MADNMAEELRREADRLRDRGKWLDAADVYAAFLLRHPDDAGMMVQRAHCLKEAGQAEAALATYRAAMALQPADAGLPVQLGHAAQRLGRPAEAEAAFARAVALAPGDEAIWRAWQGARVPQETTGGLVLDLSDIVAALLGEEPPPPGSLRLQRDLAFGALLGDAPPTLCALVPDRLEGQRLEWHRLPAGLFHRLDQLLDGPATPDLHAAWQWNWQQAQALLAEAMAAPPLAFAAGATLVSTAESWMIPGHAAALRRAREASGLRFIPLLADAAALVVPEHLPPEAALAQVRWLAALPQHADGVLLASPALREPLAALPLPASRALSLEAAPRALPPGPVPLLPRPLRHGRAYALFVAPLESRQDHRLIFSVWLELLRRQEPAAVPDLVCVGQPGWGAETALDLLENAPTLRGKVHVLPDAPPGLLATLYRHARFALHNSHHEGWGHAAAESLGRGKPILLPAHAAQREPAPPGIIVFDSGSEPALLAQLEALIAAPATLAAMETEIAAQLRPSWPDVAAEMLEAAGQLAREAPPLPPLPLTPGHRVSFARRDRYRPQPAMAVAEAALAGPGWHAAESWGVWTRPGAARLSLPLPPSLAGAVRIELDLRAPAQDQAIALQARRKGGAAAPAIEVMLPAGSDRTLSLAVPAGDGALEVLLDCGRPVQQAEGLRVGVGLRALCIARDESVEDRLAMLESRRFIVAEKLDA